MSGGPLHNFKLSVFISEGDCGCKIGSNADSNHEKSRKGHWDLENGVEHDRCHFRDINSN